MSQTVVGVFDNNQAAQRAQQDLISSGFDSSDVHIRIHEGDSSTANIENHASLGLTGSIRDFLSSLFGRDHDDIDHYSEAVRRGFAVVAITVADDALVTVARSALFSAGALDIEKQAEEWRQEGYTGYDATRKPYTADEVIADRARIRPALVDNPDIAQEPDSFPSPRVYPFRMAQIPYDDIMGTSGGVNTVSPFTESNSPTDKA